MLIPRAIVTVLALVIQSTAAEAPHFEFAGFTVETTLSVAKARFPTSSEANSYIYVSEGDSYQHIYGVSISGNRTVLFFEKRLESGRVSFPKCRTQFDEIFSKYGGPNIVQEFNEEAMPVHRRVWEKGRERLVLSCFEMDGSRYAERLEFYESEPGAD